MSTAVALPRPGAATSRLRFVTATGNHDSLDSAVAVVLSARMFNRKER